MTGLPKRVLELYGVPCIDGRMSRELQEAVKRQDCMFRNRRCFKTRKSVPEQSIGSCTVGYSDAALIVCPWRFLAEDTVFRDVARHLLPGAQELAVVPEVRVDGGTIDFIVAPVGDTGELTDLVGVEIQALDTTSSGAIWRSRQDILGGHPEEKYGYGINWKMSAKTALMQLLHKVPVFAALSSRLALVVQDHFFDYMERTFDMSAVTSPVASEPLHILVYGLHREGNRFSLRLRRRASTTHEGLQRMLRPARESLTLSKEELLDQVEALLRERKGYYVSLT